MTISELTHEAFVVGLISRLCRTAENGSAISNTTMVKDALERGES
jgi:hypothetical protein